MPNPEPITYFQRTPTDTYTQYALPHSKRKKLKKVEADVGPEIVVSATQAWQFWTPFLSAVGISIIRLEDYFIDTNGIGWNIVDAEFKAMKNVWDVKCNDQSGTFLYFSTVSLPPGTMNVAYSQTIAVTNPNGTPVFSVFLGSLPTGLILSSGGVLSGTPTVASTFSFSVAVVDNSASTIVMPYVVKILT